MSKEDALSLNVPQIQLGERQNAEESHSLLSHSRDDHVDNDSRTSILQDEGLTTTPAELSPGPRPPPPKRHSSFKVNGGPRTPNRVRFADVLSEHSASPELTPDANGGPIEPFEYDEEDYLGNGHTDGQTPLLRSVLGETYTSLPLPESTPKSSLLAAFTNMSNSIIGAGIIGLPYALLNAGLLTGIILLIALTIVVDWTIRLIPINSKLSGRDTFQGTVEHCFGRWGLAAVSAAQWAFAFGGMVAFGVIVGDTIPVVIRGAFPGIEDVSFLWLLGNRTFMIVFVIGGLAKASTLALISMLIIIITVITQGARVSKEMRGDFKGLLFINSGFFQAVGVISFAFVCHHNTLLIYSSLHTPTLNRFATVTHLSTLISLLACLAMGLAGLLTFGSKTQGNVLNNFPMNGNTNNTPSNSTTSAANPLVLIARLCFGLNMLTTLPLECFVCREVMTNFFLSPSSSTITSPPSSPSNPAWKPQLSTHIHFLLTTTLVLSAMALSVLTTDLGAVFELIGATSASMLAYILPPMCWLQLAKSAGWEKRAPAYVCVGFGFAVMISSIVESLVKFVMRG
ncbi:MAG: hypothetical protein Q9160_007247 [Pyrenula sp. 1 TL-2023]